MPLKGREETRNLGGGANIWKGITNVEGTDRV